MIKSTDLKETQNCGFTDYIFTVLHLVYNFTVYLYYSAFFETLVCSIINKDDILFKRTVTGLVFTILHTNQQLLFYSTGKSLNIIGHEVTIRFLPIHHCLHKNPVHHLTSSIKFILITIRLILLLFSHLHPGIK